MSPEITRHSTVRRAEGIIDAEIDGEAITLSLDHTNVFGMGKVGTRIWHLLDQAITVDEMLRILAEDFAVDAATCEAETLSFLQHIQREALLEVVSPDGAP